MNQMRPTLLLVTLLGAACMAMSLPTGDPEYKATPNNSPMQPENGDPYEELHVTWKEPPATPERTYIPQTGSLISIAEETVPAGEMVSPPIPDQSATTTTSLPEGGQKVVEKVVDGGPIIPEDVYPKDHSNVTASKPSEVKDAALPMQGTPNPTMTHYPIGPEAKQAYGSSAEVVASPPIIDPSKKDVFGVNPPPVTFDRPDNVHPMEVKTPLIDNTPCDPNRILQVSVPAAEYQPGFAVPFLPRRFGCSSYNDVSREKLSPEISWSNVTDDAFEFSLQLVDMGENCNMYGEEVGRIHWHVTGIKAAPSITLKEGASKDMRLLHGGKELTNQWLEDYYSGPCPAPGTVGCYRFKVLAHRANGWCQCGFQDVLFERPGAPETK